MTTIIGIQKPDGCEIWADGRVTDGDYRPYEGEMPKAVERGEYLLAPAGPGAACDFITQGWLPPPFRGAQAYREMVSSFVPALRAEVREATGYDLSDSSNAERLSLLVGVHGVLYCIATDGTVLLHSDGFYAIGTGAQYALGALYAEATPARAMHIAQMNDIYTGKVDTILWQPKPGFGVPNVGSTDDDSSPEPSLRVAS